LVSSDYLDYALNESILKKREQKPGFQRWQIRPFLEKRQKPPDFDKVL